MPQSEHPFFALMRDLYYLFIKIIKKKQTYLSTHLFHNNLLSLAIILYDVSTLGNRNRYALCKLDATVYNSPVCSEDADALAGTVVHRNHTIASLNADASCGKRVDGSCREYEWSRKL